MSAKVLRLVLGLFFTLTVSFTTAGYQALLPALLDEKVYYSKCNTTISSSLVAITPYNFTTSISTKANNTCEDQLLTFNVHVGHDPVKHFGVWCGFIVAYIGPRFTCCIGALLMALGALLFAFSTAAFEAWMAGYIIMAMAGPFIAFPMFTLPSQFPSRQGLIFSLIVGAFDGSAAMMFFFRLLHFNASLSLETIYIGFAVLCGTLFFASLWIFIPPPEAGNQEMDVANESTDLIPQHPLEEKKLRDMVLSWPFVLITIWCSVYVTTKYFYLSTYNSQIEWITNNNAEQSEMFIFVFSIMLPAAGFFTPVTSFLLDRYGSVAAILSLVLCSLLVGVCSVFHVYPLQYFTMLVIVFKRFLFFASIPFILTNLFGAKFGPTTLYGAALFFASCANLSNYAWTSITFSTLHNNFLVFDVILNALCVAVGIILAFFVGRWLKRSPRDKLLN